MNKRMLIDALVKSVISGMVLGLAISVSYHLNGITGLVILALGATIAFLLQSTVKSILLQGKILDLQRRVNEMKAGYVPEEIQQ